MARLKPDTWLDLSDRLHGMQLHDLSMGYDGCVYLLASSQHIKKHDGRSPLRHTDEPYDCTVFKIDGQKQITTYHIPQQTMVYHYVQPLPHDRLMLAGARAKHYNAHQYDRNAQVFSYDGRLQQAFNIGDGVWHLQTTSDGTIWTGYSDAGRLWRNGKEKALPGVVQWNQDGELLNLFDGAEVRHPVFDCYALNAQDDTTVWVCYYPDFPLVRLKDGAFDAIWRNTLSRVGAIAMSDEYIVFYRNKTEFRVYRFDDTLQPQNQIQHRMTRPHRITARGDTFVFLYNWELHRLTVDDIVTA